MLLKFQGFSSSTLSGKRLLAPDGPVVAVRKATRSQSAWRANEKMSASIFAGDRGALKGAEKCFLYSSWLFQTQDKFLRTHVKCCSPSLARVKNKTGDKKFPLPFCTLNKMHKYSEKVLLRRAIATSEIKTGTWSEAACCPAAGWGSRSQRPWPAGCARTERSASRLSSPQSSRPARSRPATRLQQTETVS